MMIHVPTAAFEGLPATGPEWSGQLGHERRTVVHRSRDEVFEVAVADVAGKLVRDALDDRDRLTVVLAGAGEITEGDAVHSFTAGDLVIEQSPVAARTLRSDGFRGVEISRRRSNEEVVAGREALRELGLGHGVLRSDWQWPGPGVRVLEAARAEPHHVPPDDQHRGAAIKHWEAFYKSPDEIVEAGYETFTGESWNPARDGYDGAAVILSGRGALETSGRRLEFGAGDIVIHDCPIDEKRWLSVDDAGYRAAYVTRFRSTEIVRRWRYAPDGQLIYS